jgi:hypothetical protein
MHLLKNFLILANFYLLALIVSLAKGCLETREMVFMAGFAKELQMAYLILLTAMSFRAAYLMMLTYRAAYFFVYFLAG